MPLQDLNTLENDDEWWEHAYQLFLQNEPLNNILRHAKLWIEDSTHNDYFFDQKSAVPFYGKIHGVDKRAILVVISRASKMEMKDWTTLKELSESNTTSQPLQKQITELINCLVHWMYHVNGEPRSLE
jgi:hypothetical protein